ncbi:hypothetical protein AC1031_007141 [Aphanomyces cochlioides]|nr:hypothetical protein AC1031_007141 [Aphanomyces cochlioides]
MRNDDDEAAESLQDMIVSDVPTPHSIDESCMTQYFDIDQTFESKINLLGSKSWHRSSIVETCRSNSEVVNWQSTNARLNEVTALSVYISFTNRNLIIINLSNNRIGPEGCTMLGKALTTNNTVEILNLSSCDLTGNPYRPNYDGLMTLVKGLESRRSVLLHLDVSSTALMPQGVRIICAALAFHSTITSVNLSSNQAGLLRDKQGYLGIANLVKNAFTAMATVLKDNRTLTEIDAKGCGFKSKLPETSTRVYSSV